MEIPYLRAQHDLLNELTLTLEQIPSDGGQRTLRNALRTWSEMVFDQLGDDGDWSGRPRFSADDKVTFTELAGLADGGRTIHTRRTRGRIINPAMSRGVRGYIIRDELGTLYRWVPEIDLEPAR